MSPDARCARARHARAASSASFSAPCRNGPWRACAVATASMRVPIVIHQLVHPEDDDTYLEPRRQREEQDLVARLEPPGLEILVQRDEVRRRCGVAALRDVLDEVFRRHAQAGGELAGALSDRPHRSLVRNEVVDVREAQAGLLE